MEISEIIGITAGVCTSVASVPQIVTTVKKKQAADVSPLMFCVLLAGNGLWVYYGFLKSDIPIWATNMVSVTLDLVMLYLRFKYVKK
jgi:MtN3 and saliva related transmembrane protein